MNGEGIVDRDDAVRDDSSDAETKLLKQTIGKLEEEKASLVIENKKAREKVESLTEELQVTYSIEKELKEKMEAEMTEFESSRILLEEAAKRNVELETEVFRLQHDLFTAIRAQEEASAEITEVRGLLGEVEVSLEDAKKEKAEIERKVREYERTVGVLEVRETEEKSKRLRLEEEMKDKTVEKERRIKELQEKLEAAENEIILLKEAKLGTRALNGIDNGNMDSGVDASKIIAGSVGGAVLIAVAAATIVLLCKSRTS